jgi:hypothetical protein
MKNLEISLMEFFLQNIVVNVRVLGLLFLQELNTLSQFFLKKVLQLQDLFTGRNWV